MYVKIIDGKQVFSSCKSLKMRNGVWVSNPTSDQIAAEGWEVYVPASPDPRVERMNAILNELKDMDYLTSKYIDGEDMTQYGDWQEARKALREEYRSLEGE